MADVEFGYLDSSGAWHAVTTLGGRTPYLPTTNRKRHAEGGTEDESTRRGRGGGADPGAQLSQGGSPAATISAAQKRSAIWPSRQR